MLADNHMADANATTAAAVTPKRFRILVVDDNHDSALSLAMMLSIMGHETRTAHDGESAVATAESFLPDVVLLDIGLPKLNGYEVAQRIREQAWGTSMFLIAVTGWGQDEDRQRSSEVGLNVHMVKPVEPAALEQLLAGLARGDALKHHN
jgi:CheY-like chemotaxis protein